MEFPAAKALRLMNQGTWLLNCYGLVSLAILAVLGATTTGTHTFARTAAVLVVLGLVLQGAVGAVHRRARRALLAARPELSGAPRRHRALPGTGLAVFVYLPFLLLVVSLSATVRQAVHPAVATGVTRALVSGCQQQAGTVACSGSWTVSGRVYTGPVDVAEKPPLKIALVQISYDLADPQVIYDAAHPVPSGGVASAVGFTLFFAFVSAGAGVAYDRNCRAPYLGFLTQAARHESAAGLAAPG